MEPKLNIALTVAETNFVLQALAELPFKTVSGLIVNIKTQADDQLKPAAAEEPVPQ